jgi:hypothetical protein
MLKVLFLPCDTRPPTLELPLQLGRLAGLEVSAPPLAMLNDLNHPGDTARIGAWLLEQAAMSDAAVVTLETLCLGGMIPARRVSDSPEEALSRLEVLREVKRRHPTIRLLAYGVIVRVARSRKNRITASGAGSCGSCRSGRIARSAAATRHNSRRRAMPFHPRFSRIG